MKKPSSTLAHKFPEFSAHAPLSGLLDREEHHRTSAGRLALVELRRRRGSESLEVRVVQGPFPVKKGFSRKRTVSESRALRRLRAAHLLGRTRGGAVHVGPAGLHRLHHLQVGVDGGRTPRRVHDPREPVSDLA